MMTSQISSNISKYYVWKLLTGFYFLFPLQAIYPLSKGVTIPQLALYVSIGTILTTILEIPTGFIADRFSRKFSVCLGFIFNGLGYLGLFFIHDFYSLLPLALVFGLGTALISGADSALIYDELKSQDRESEYLKVTTRGALFGTISGAIASFLGPILFTLQPILPFILTTITYIISALFIITFKETRYSHEINKQIKIFDGVKNIFKSRPILIIVVIQTLLLVLAFVYYQLLFFPKVNELGLDIKYLGVLDVVNISLTSLLLFLLPKLIFKKDKINIVFFTLLACIMFIILSNSNHLIIVIMFGILFDSAWSIRREIMSSVTNKYFESHNRALSLSSVSMVTNLGAALLLPVAAYIFNISYLFAIVPVLIIAATLFFYPANNPKNPAPKEAGLR